VQENAWTMLHERYNARWIEQQRVGITVRSFPAEICDAVGRLLAPKNYQCFRARIDGAMGCSRSHHFAASTAETETSPASGRVRDRDPFP